MKQLKFTLADVLTVSTAVAFGFICFLSQYYISFGNIKESLAWALVITFSLTATAYIAKLLKQSNRRFKMSKFFEIFFLLLFTGLTVYFTFTTFTHYFNVLNRKAEISSKLERSINLADSMFDKYESDAERRLKVYRGHLEQIVMLKEKGVDTATYSKVFGPSKTPPDSVKIAIKMASLSGDLFPSNYSDSITGKGIKESAISWLLKSKRDVVNWKSIGIITVASDVERNTEGWKNQLKLFYKSKAFGEPQNYYNFEYDLKFDEVKPYFTESERPSLLALAIASGAYLLMLVSWFVAKRDYRSSTEIKSYEIVL